MRYVWIAVDAVVDFAGPVIRVLTQANALQDLGWVSGVGLVEFGMGEGGDFADHILEAAEARAAVPTSVIYLGVDFAHAQGFGSDGFGTLVECGLRMWM